jgi:hypothetical protein
VSAVVQDPHETRALHGESPLTHLPFFTPVSWLLQTLGLFFVASGYGAGKRRATPSAIGRRTPYYERLGRPLLLFAVVSVPALVLLAVVGAPATTQHLVLSLLSHPLWFIPVYLLLVSAAPLLCRLTRRWGLWAVAIPVILVAASDATRTLGHPAWWSICMTPIGWTAPYLTGIVIAQRPLSRRAGPLLFGAGVGGGAVLILLAGYPPGAVGVPGDRWSNLDPPSLLAVALVSAQLGVFLVVRRRLKILLRRQWASALVALLNRRAMEIFCWHQMAMLLVTSAAMLFGAPPGLLDQPDGWWPLFRLAWLPLFAVVLAVMVWFFAPPATGDRRPAHESVADGATGDRTVLPS